MTKNISFLLLVCLIFLESSIKYVRKIFRKTDTSYPLIRTPTCAYHEVRSVSFSEDFAYVLNELSFIFQPKSITTLVFFIYPRSFSNQQVNVLNNHCAAWKIAPQAINTCSLPYCKILELFIITWSISRRRFHFIEDQLIYMVSIWSYKKVLSIIQFLIT